MGLRPQPVPRGPAWLAALLIVGFSALCLLVAVVTRRDLAAVVGCATWLSFQGSSAFFWQLALARGRVTARLFTVTVEPHPWRDWLDAYVPLVLPLLLVAALLLALWRTLKTTRKPAAI